MKKLRAAVAGVGFIGAAHIEAIRRLGYVDVVAICVRRGADEIAEKLNVPKAYADYKEMIDNENLDVLHVCTPNISHFEIAKYAIERGVHVLCEKPLAFTVEQAQELTKLAAEKNVVNGVNFHCRYYPMIRQMKEMIDRDAIGDIISIHGGYLQDWLLLDTDYSWRIDSDKSGKSRAVADIGSHWVDAVEFVTGLKIKRVFADFATFYPTRRKPLQKVETFANKVETVTEYEEYKVDTEDYAQVLLEFDNGAKGNMIVSQMYAGRKNQMLISVAGKKQALYFDSEALNELWLGSRDTYNQTIVKDPALMEPAAARDTNFYPGGHVEGFPDAFAGNFRAFYDKVLGRGNSCCATFADGLREMKLCEAMVKSAKEGRWVDVD